MESLAKRADNLSSKDSNKNKIYLDVANMRYHFFNKEDHWDLLGSIANIEDFIKASQQSGWKLQGFLDFKKVSQEGIDVSKKRREFEIIDEKCDFPCILYKICEAVFERFGIEIHRNLEADCYDTLASWAQRDGAAIFSADRDFFCRYIEKKYEVFNQYTISPEGGIIFSHYDSKKPYEKTLRNIIVSPPKTTIFKGALTYNFSFDDVVLLGCPSALVKYFGNPNLILRPLRKAAIYKLNGKPRKEIIPFWNNVIKKVEWDETFVEGNPEFASLLNDRYRALDHFFNMKEILKRENEFDKVSWRNFLFSLYAETFHICSMIETYGNEKLIQWLIEAKTKVCGEDVEKICLKCQKKFYENVNVFHKLCRVCWKAEKSKSKEEPQGNMNRKVCVTCKNNFFMSEKEESYFLEKGLFVPKKCEACRKDKKNTPKQNRNEPLDFNFRNKK